MGAVEWRVKTRRYECGKRACRCWRDSECRVLVVDEETIYCKTWRDLRREVAHAMRLPEDRVTLYEAPRDTPPPVLFCHGKPVHLDVDLPQAVGQLYAVERQRE